MDLSKLMIEVQCFNRKTITEITLEQLKQHKGESFLRIVNDYSTEYDNSWLEQFGDEVIQWEKKLNINRLKFRTFKHFMDTDMEWLYMCDNDILHDPDFLSVFKKYYKNNLPITLYRSSFIHSFGDNVSKYLKKWDIVSLKSGLFGGASVFLSRDNVSKIVSCLPESEDVWNESCLKEAWDSKIQKMIDPKRLYLISNDSYCEHYGVGGQNHKEENSDIALNPTKYLIETKDEVKKKISSS